MTNEQESVAQTRPQPVDEEELSSAQRNGLHRLLAALAGLPGGGAARKGDAAKSKSIKGLRFTPKEGRYQRQQEITRGGMGAIMRVVDRDLDRPAAMKVLLPEVLQDPTAPARFVAEARITALLEHPNIVPVHDIGQTSAEGLFFTMKLVAGQPLNEILSRLSRREPACCERYDRHDLLVIFRKVCDAVAFAHSRGVIHRDIKPHNIMVGRYGEVLLMDWGLAKYMDAPAGAANPADLPAAARPVGVDTTTAGIVKGTPCYMAPEQACGRTEAVDRQTDVFLLGATLYHIVTLFPPYSGQDADEIVLKAAQGHVVPPNERNPAQQVPEELSRIVAKAMAIRKHERYAGVESLVADVDAWMAGRTLYERHVFHPGQALMRVGERGAEGYVILHGRVEVLEERDGKSMRLTVLGPGDTVGEMAIITDEARSASVVAREETEVQIINRQLMRDEMKKMAPWMDRVVTALAQRLQTANTRVHPLLVEDSALHVLNQLALLLRAGLASGQPPQFDLAATSGRLALNLMLPVENVQRALTRLAETGLVTMADGGLLTVPEPQRLERFAAFCDRRLMATCQGPVTPVLGPELGRDEEGECSRLLARILMSRPPSLP